MQRSDDNELSFTTYVDVQLMVSRDVTNWLTIGCGYQGMVINGYDDGARHTKGDAYGLDLCDADGCGIGDTVLAPTGLTLEYSGDDNGIAETEQGGSKKKLIIIIAVAVLLVLVVIYRPGLEPEAEPQRLTRALQPADACARALLPGVRGAERLG